MHQGNLNGQYYIKRSFGLGRKVLLHLSHFSPFVFAFRYRVTIRTFSFYGFSTWFDLLSP